MEPQTSTIPALSPLEKQQVIYAALMRFSDVGIRSRKRALGRIVLSGLIGSNPEAPYRTSKIKENLSKRPEAPSLKDTVLTETLDELALKEKIVKVPQKSHKDYYLTETGKREIEEVLNQAGDVFKPVLEGMLRNTDSGIPPTVRKHLFQAFILECFSQFGGQIASSLTREPRNAILGVSEIDEVFKKASKGKKLTDSERESMYIACKGFISSAEEADVRLRYCLTQGYFLAELLCVDKAPFLPLSREEFADAVFYLDTNVLFIGLLATGNRSEFAEMLHLSRKLGVELRVISATLEEARRVMASRREELQRHETIPPQVTDLAHDQFWSAFREQKSLEPALTINQFFDRLDQRTANVTKEWPIRLDNRKEEAILEDQNLAEWTKVMQEEATVTRQSKKPNQVLRHDLALFAVISAERNSNRKTWVLTIDQSLIRAGSKLKSSERVQKPLYRTQSANGGGSSASSTKVQEATPVESDSLPFCFSLAAFLQIISPFTTTREEHSLAEIFSGLIQDHLATSERLLSTQEMNMLLDMHSDLMTTPNDQLVRALTTVKKIVFQGHELTAADERTIGVELRLILRVDEKERALETAKAMRELAEKVEAAQAQTCRVLEEMKRDRSRAETKLWRDRAAMSFAAAAVVWLFQNDIVAALISRGLTPTRSATVVQLVVAILAATLIWPSIRFAKATPSRTQAWLVVSCLIVLVGISLTRLIPDANIAKWQAWLTFAVSVVGIVNLILPRKETAAEKAAS